MRYLTTSEFAEQVGVTDRTVRNWIAQGRLHAEKVGTWWRIPEHQAEDISGLHQRLIALANYLDTDPIDNYPYLARLIREIANGAELEIARRRASGIPDDVRSPPSEIRVRDNPFW